MTILSVAYIGLISSPVILCVVYIGLNFYLLLLYIIKCLLGLKQCHEPTSYCSPHFGEPTSEQLIATENWSQKNK